MKDIVALIEQLMNTYANDLKRTAYVMLGDHTLAEDVTQETFISFYKNVHRFRDESSYKTYLYRILINHVKMHWRKRIIKPLDDSDKLLEKVAFEEDLVTVMDLNAALKQIKPIHSEVITLHYFNQYSVEEVASILDLSQSNVKMRLKRGREEMKKVLKGGQAV